MDEGLQQGTDLIMDRTLYLAFRMANPIMLPVKPPAVTNADKLPWQMAGAAETPTQPAIDPVTVHGLGSCYTAYQWQSLRRTHQLA